MTPNRRTMRNPRSVLLVAVAGLLVGCGGGYDEPVEPAAVDPWPLAANIKPAVDDPLRPEEDRARDADRRPAEVLAFFGIGEGMRIADLQATLGYYTEVLSSVVGPEGRVFAQNNNFVLEGFAEQGLTERLAKLQEAGRANVTRVDAELDEMELPPNLDAVLFVRFYHDLFWLPTPDGNLNDRPEFLRRVYETLKPGGVFGVVDHHAEAGSEERDAMDPEEGSHRIDVELVKREILAAGFVCGF